MASNSKKLVLGTNDGHEFEIEETLAAVSSGILKVMIDEGVVEGGIPVPNVTSKSLEKIIEYWHRHAEEDEDDSVEKKAAIMEWDDEFVKLDGDHKERFELIKAADYLDAKPLHSILCQAVADTIMGMPVEEVRELFNIGNYFSLEEEIRGEYAWAFENS